MIDLSPDILQALEQDGDIVSRVGFDADGNTRIYQRNIPYPDLYPQITFFEITNFDSSYADDDPVEHCLVSGEHLDEANRYCIDNCRG